VAPAELAPSGAAAGAAEDRPAAPVVAVAIDVLVRDPLLLDAAAAVEVRREWDAVERPCAFVTDAWNEQAHTTSVGSRTAAARTGDRVMVPR
jgi:hypothetical protein